MNYQILNQIKIKPMIASVAVLGLLISMGSLFIVPSVQAGQMELSGTFSFSGSQFGNANYQWTRRWGASIGYYFFALSELEFAVQDVLYRTKIGSIEDTTFHDKIYSINWVQSLAPRSFIIQPYFKVGVGQLNRDASGSYQGTSPPARYDSLTGILGAGLRVYVLHFISLKGEAVTYLAGGSVATWQNNFSINGGVSVYF